MWSGARVDRVGVSPQLPLATEVCGALWEYEVRATETSKWVAWYLIVLEIQPTLGEG